MMALLIKRVKSAEVSSEFHKASSASPVEKITQLITTKSPYQAEYTFVRETLRGNIELGTIWTFGDCTFLRDSTKPVKQQFKLGWFSG